MTRLPAVLTVCVWIRWNYPFRGILTSDGKNFIYHSQNAWPKRRRATVKPTNLNALSTNTGMLLGVKHSGI